MTTIKKEIYLYHTKPTSEGGFIRIDQDSLTFQLQIAFINRDERRKCLSSKFEIDLFQKYEIPFFLLNIPNIMVLDMSLNGFKTDIVKLRQILTKDVFKINVELYDNSSGKMVVNRSVKVRSKLQNDLKNIIENQFIKYSNWSEVDMKIREIEIEYDPIQMFYLRNN